MSTLIFFAEWYGIPALILIAIWQRDKRQWERDERERAARLARLDERDWEEARRDALTLSLLATEWGPTYEELDQLTVFVPEEWLS